MTKNKSRTKEVLHSDKRMTYQRMRIVIEVDWPEQVFERDHFNNAAKTLINHVENDPDGVFERGSRVVLLTTEDA